MNSLEEIKINDLEPFHHGQEGTHSICRERMEILAAGGDAQCCFCKPHDGCTIIK